VNHRTNPAFWALYDQLDEGVQRLADKNFQLLRSSPRHPSLQFKRVGRSWSARAGSHHRAVAVQRDDDFVWYWIGPHDEYDQMLK
jgi:hypothetical protein